MTEPTYFRVVCDQHRAPIVLADITRDPDQEALRQYESEVRRWDRHNSGEEPVLVPETGRPYPRQYRPPIPRRSSRQITVTTHPFEYIYVPELVDSSGPSEPDESGLDLEWNAWVSDRVAKTGKPPHNGYVRACDCEVGDAESTDGHLVRIRCAMCEQVRGKRRKVRNPAASAETLAMALDRVVRSLDTMTVPVLDEYRQETGETVLLRILPLTSLESVLADGPRG